MKYNDVFCTENIGAVEDAVHSIYETLANIFEELESSICEIAEKLGEIIGSVDWTNFFKQLKNVTHLESQCTIFPNISILSLTQSPYS